MESKNDLIIYNLHFKFVQYEIKMGCTASSDQVDLNNQKLVSLKEKKDKLIIASLNYGGIMNSPYEFYTAIYKQSLQKVSRTYESVIGVYCKSFEKDTFEWNHGKLEMNFKRKRYSPLYQLRVGIVDGKFINRKMFESIWDEVYLTKCPKNIRISTKEIQKQHVKLFDFIVFHSLLATAYGIQKSFEELIQEDPQAYLEKYSSFFNLSFLDEKKKLKKIQEGMKNVNADIFFVQQSSLQFYEKMELTGRYYIEIDAKQDTVILAKKQLSKSKEDKEKVLNGLTKYQKNQLEFVQNEGIALMFLEGLILIGVHLSSKIEKNVKEVKKLKQLLVSLNLIFPEYELICGGDINSYLQYDGYFTELDFEMYPKSNEIHTTYKKRSMMQGQFNKGDKLTIESKDKVISTLPIIGKPRIRFIASQVFQEDKAEFLPSDSHPFDHYLVYVEVSLTQQLSTNVKHLPHPKQFIQVATLNYGANIQTPFEFYSENTQNQLKEISKIFIQLIFQTVDIEDRKNFKWKFDKLEQKFKMKRYSPLYNKNVGIKRNKFISEEEFEEQWKKSYDKWYNKDKNQNIETKIEELLQKSQVMKYDMLIFQALLIYSYGKKPLSQLLQENPSQYEQKLSFFFDLKYMNENYKQKKLFQFLEQKKIDFLFLTSYSGQVRQQLQSDYYLSENNKHILIAAKKKWSEPTERYELGEKNAFCEILIVQDYILVGMRLSESLESNNKQIYTLKELLLKLIKQYPTKSLICGGDLKNYLDYDEKFNQRLFSIYPENKNQITTISKRTMLQSQFRKGDISIIKSQDKIISTLPLINRSISYINGAKPNEYSFVPCDYHPYPHFILHGTISAIKSHQIKNRVTDYEKKFITIATLNYGGIMDSPYQFYTQQFEDQLRKISQIFAKLIPTYLPQDKLPFDPNHFQWEAKIDKEFKVQRYSPLYNKSVGLKGDTFINKQQFSQKWDQVYDLHATTKNRKKIQQESKDMQNKIHFTKTFDLISFHSILAFLYGEQKPLDQLLRENNSKYVDFANKIFNQPFLDKEKKFKIFKQNFDSIEADIFTIQQVSKQFEPKLFEEKFHYQMTKDNLILAKKEVFRKTNGELEEPVSVPDMVSRLNQSQKKDLTFFKDKDLKDKIESFIIGKYIIICAHLTSKKAENLIQVPKFKRFLLALKNIFQDYTIICGGDINSFLKYDENFTKFDYSIFPQEINTGVTTIKKRTMIQSQFKKANKIVVESKDKIISTIAFDQKKIMYINGIKPNQDSLVPNSIHPFDHFCVLVQISKPALAKKQIKEKSYLKNELVVVTYNQKHIVHSLNQLYSTEQEVELSEISQIFHQLLPTIIKDFDQATFKWNFGNLDSNFTSGRYSPLYNYQVGIENGKFISKEKFYALWDDSYQNACPLLVKKQATEAHRNLLRSYDFLIFHAMLSHLYGEKKPYKQLIQQNCEQYLNCYCDLFNLSSVVDKQLKMKKIMNASEDIQFDALIVEEYSEEYYKKIVDENMYYVAKSKDVLILVKKSYFKRKYEVQDKIKHLISKNSNDFLDQDNVAVMHLGKVLFIAVCFKQDATYQRSSNDLAILLQELNVRLPSYTIICAGEIMNNLLLEETLTKSNFQIFPSVSHYQTIKLLKLLQAQNSHTKSLCIEKSKHKVITNGVFGIVGDHNIKYSGHGVPLLEKYLTTQQDVQCFAMNLSIKIKEPIKKIFE